MEEITLARKVKAVRWEPADAPVPAGCHKTMPEIQWSAGRKYVYFTYGTLRPKHWLGTEKLAAQPESNAFEGWVGYTPKEGVPYWRECLPFAMWSIKSEASRSGDHRAVFLNLEDENELLLWHNYCSMEQWPNPLPRFAEYRVTDGGYGRGYRPIYLTPGEWLVFEGDQTAPKVISDAEFNALRESA